jgi:hypothetical protein
MTDCPNTELMAAFIDGKLPSGAREAVIAHLADCETCYAVVSDSLTIRQEIGSRARMRMRRVIAYTVPAALAAAAVLLLVVRTWQHAQEFKAKPAQEAAYRQEPSGPGPQVKAGKAPAPRSYAGDLAARLLRSNKTIAQAKSGEKPSAPRASFGFSSAVPPDKAAFRIGMCLTDLEVARQARDIVTIEASAKQLIELLKPIESSYGPLPPAIEPRGAGRTDVQDSGRYEGLSPAIEKLFANRKEGVYVMFGAWVEAAGLAAAVSDAAFFKPAEVRAFTSELRSRNEPVGTLNNLSQLETIISSDRIQPDQFKAISRLLADIQEMY